MNESQELACPRTQKRHGRPSKFQHPK